MSWIFPLDCVVCSLGGVGLGGLGGGRGVGGAHRISHLEKADVRSFGARAVFPRCHCFRFHLREDSRLHTSPFFFCFVFLLWVRYTGFRTCLKFWGEFRSFFFLSFFLQPWGTSRIPTRTGRASRSCSLFFRPKSSPPHGKARCLLLKW